MYVPQDCTFQYKVSSHVERKELPWILVFISGYLRFYLWLTKWNLFLENTIYTTRKRFIHNIHHQKCIMTSKEATSWTDAVYEQNNYGWKRERLGDLELNAMQSVDREMLRRNADKVKGRK